jgi:hypothetical protein
LLAGAHAHNADGLFAQGDKNHTITPCMFLPMPILARGQNQSAIKESLVEIGEV